VLVYKVDRLSRSLLDFARMMETFDKHQVAFVSVTQQFNTSTSMGRLADLRFAVFLADRQPHFKRRLRGEIVNSQGAEQADGRIRG
jgi:DNA invertase Pin-like site-specific DNA recombinase